MWKIALSAVLTIFTLTWASVLICQVKRKYDEVFGDDDDTWPPGAVTA